MTWPHRSARISDICIHFSRKYLWAQHLPTFNLKVIPLLLPFSRFLPDSQLLTCIFEDTPWTPQLTLLSTYSMACYQRRFSFVHQFLLLNYLACYCIDSDDVPIESPSYGYVISYIHKTHFNSIDTIDNYKT